MPTRPPTGTDKYWLNTVKLQPQSEIKATIKQEINETNMFRFL